MKLVGFFLADVDFDSFFVLLRFVVSMRSWVIFDLMHILCVILVFMGETKPVLVLIFQNITFSCIENDQYEHCSIKNLYLYLYKYLTF